MVTLTFVTLEIDLTQETLGIADPGTIAETTSVVVAVIAETFQWVGYADTRGFVFYRDGTLLPGMITIHLDDPLGSFETDFMRYSTSNPTVVYGDQVDNKGNKIVDHVVWGPFSDLTKSEAWDAMQHAGL